MTAGNEIKRLLSKSDPNDQILWIIAMAIVLFWLLTASHLWGS
jgi:hypothetical protein